MDRQTEKTQYHDIDESVGTPQIFPVQEQRTGMESQYSAELYVDIEPAGLSHTTESVLEAPVILPKKRNIRPKLAKRQILRYNTPEMTSFAQMHDLEQVESRDFDEEPNITQKSMSELRSRRIAHGFTLEELAALAGISPSYLSRLEKKQRRMNKKVSLAVAGPLQCSAEALLMHMEDDFSYPAFNRYSTVYPLNKWKHKTVALAPVMPVYAMKLINGDQKETVGREELEKEITLDTIHVVSTRARYSEFANKTETMAAKTCGYFSHYFGQSATVFLYQTTQVMPEDIVFIMKNNVIDLYQIWSMTPLTIQFCRIHHFELLRSRKSIPAEIFSSLQIQIHEEDKNNVLVYLLVGFVRD